MAAKKKPVTRGAKPKKAPTKKKVAKALREVDLEKKANKSANKKGLYFNPERMKKKLATKRAKAQGMQGRYRSANPKPKKV